MTEPTSVVLKFANGAKAFQFFMYASKVRDERPELEIEQVLLIPEHEEGGSVA